MSRRGKDDGCPGSMKPKNMNSPSPCIIARKLQSRDGNEVALVRYSESDLAARRNGSLASATAAILDCDVIGCGSAFSPFGQYAPVG